MLRVLIVDDEKPIRQWFEHVIRQYPDEFYIVGLAANGQEALKLCLKLMPDIIITDIKMPVMNGLELIEQVNNLNANISFLILSNYDEFEFVRQGLRIGVKDYLLKAETDDQDIIAVIRKIAMEQRHIARQKVSQAGTGKQEDRLLLRDVLNQPEEWLQPIMAQGLLCWIYCGVNTLAKDEDQRSRGAQPFKELSNNWAKEMFDHVQLFVDECDNMAFLLNIYSSETVLSQAELVKICTVWNRELREKYGYNASFGISRSFASYAQLKGEFLEAKRAYRQKFYTDTQCVHLTGSDGSRKDNTVLLDILKPLKSAELLENNLTEQVLDKLNELERYRLDPSEVIDAFQLFLERMANQLLERTGEHYSEKHGPLTDIAKLSSWNEFCEFIHYHLHAMQQLAYRHTFVYSATTNQIMAYIRQHFAQKLSMSLLAEQVHLNENYLSQVFKKDTGITITSYIIDVRMEQAKKLLATQRYKINEVAAEVGYASEAHFSTAFKTFYRVTPSQYIESLRNSK
ncbi:helix-turn-helix domain-containing protein [Paenibacillus sp. MY03]|uniref:helix-turn-helix domain-containing protein n=1 Tax=Paenibacillus sp. MY03 TaxID=302980 RepID=UPI0015C58D4A|nr:helix-turn-helix domain-containing protein [Paenibacillus sp. MY03]